jgi:hypothetical protein
MHKTNERRTRIWVQSMLYNPSQGEKREEARCMTYTARPLTRLTKSSSISFQEHSFRILAVIISIIAVLCLTLTADRRYATFIGLVTWRI